MNENLIPIEEFIKTNISGYILESRDYKRGYWLIVAYIKLLEKPLTKSMIIGKKAIIEVEEVKTISSTKYQFLGETIAEKYATYANGKSCVKFFIRIKTLKELLVKTKEIPLKKGISLISLLETE